LRSGAGAGEKLCTTSLSSTFIMALRLEVCPGAIKNPVFAND
jgi:hypothetical protein